MVANPLHYGPREVPRWVVACSGPLEEPKVETVNRIMTYWLMNRRMAERYRPKDGPGKGCPYHQPSSQRTHNKTLMSALTSHHYWEIGTDDLNSHPKSFQKQMEIEYARRTAEYVSICILFSFQ